MHICRLLRAGGAAADPAGAVAAVTRLWYGTRAATVGALVLAASVAVAAASAVGAASAALKL